MTRTSGKARGWGAVAMAGLMACGGEGDRSDLLADEPAGGPTADGGAAEAPTDQSTLDQSAANELAQAAFYGLERRVEIELELDPADWALLRQEGRSVIDTFVDPNSTYEYTFFSADATIDGQRYEDISIRKKGYLGSLSADRPSIKLNLRRDGRGLSHLGLEELTLNNDRQDPSHTHQCLAYGAFAAAGAPASRCGLARVVVNGEDLGTYTNVEPIEAPLLARHFAGPGGNLYEGQIVDFVPEQLELFQRKNNEEDADRSDLSRLVSALEASDEQLVERLGEALDLDAFRTFWALETLLGHWDGYAGNVNNYYVYNDPASDRLVFLPWGTDGAFQGQNPFDFANTSIAVYARGRIANRLYALPAERQAYRDRLAELVEEVWVEERMMAELEQIAELAADATPAALDVQRALIAAHGDALRAELARPAPEWIDPPPLAAGPPPCAAGGPGEIQGTFSTTWGTLATPDAGSASLQASIDGQPLEAAGAGAAGIDEAIGDGAPRLRLTLPLTPERLLALDVMLTARSFEPGSVAFHGLETVGFASVIDTVGGLPLFGGFLSDGAIELDAASMEEGAPVSGRFSGRLLQFGCFLP